MQCKKIAGYFFCLILCACSNNKNPYENSMGIAPAHLAEIDTAHYTIIKWKDTVIDFGTIRAGDSANMKFEFTNAGKTLLFIFNVKTTCGCTIADASKDPVPPGKSGFVTATFTSNQTGEVNRKLFVFGNTK